MLPILTVTLNPALDITTGVDRLLPQQKLRCSVPRRDPGGGGINVSRAIAELGGTSRAFVALGGATGAQMRELLADSGFATEFWPLPGDTRFSLTVMEEETGLHYRFVLPGPSIPPGEDTRLLTRLGEMIAAEPGYVVGSGSIPPGLPDSFYADLARMTRERGGKFIIDTHGPALKAATEARPYLVRLNHLEAQELLGGDADVAAHTLARALVRQGLAEIAIVTLGERGAIVASHDEEFELVPPRVTVRSSVGAGDSFVAALTLGLARQWPLREAARFAVAAAAAAVTSEATELCKRPDVERNYRAIGGTMLTPA